MSHDAASFPAARRLQREHSSSADAAPAQMLQNGPLAHTLGDSHALQAALVVVAPVVITGPYLRAARRLRTNSGTDSGAGSASGSHPRLIVGARRGARSWTTTTASNRLR